MIIQPIPKRPKNWLAPGAEWGHEYKCPKGHVRLEHKEIMGKLPICSTCHMKTGEIHHLAYSRKVSIGRLPRNPHKKKRK